MEFGEGEGKVPLDNIAKSAEAYMPKERVTYKMSQGTYTRNTALKYIPHISQRLRGS